MKFLTYQDTAGNHLGLIHGSDERILDVARAAKAIGEDAPKTMLDLIDQGEAGIALAHRLLKADFSEEAYAGSGVKIIAPIPRPRKNIFAIGLNYVKHNQEFTGSNQLPEHPIIFTKAPTTVIGPNDSIRLRPDLTPEVDYEGELAVVIGKGGRDIPEDKALEHIFGYTIINDVTARDLQKRTGQWFMGKSLDSFCPMGPYLVHQSAISWPVSLDIQTHINEELRQSSNTEHLYFKIPKLIASVSAGVSLEPGDIIATGTPEGVGMGFAPPKFLQAGDTVKIEIEQLGILSNPVTD